jgi:hypothetical protein
MDRYHARTNVEAQQVPDQPIDPARRRDNLMTPPPGDPGAHGEFDSRARARSPQVWASTHSRVLAAGAVAAAIAGAVLRRHVA